MLSAFQGVSLRCRVIRLGWIVCGTPCLYRPSQFAHGGSRPLRYRLGAGPSIFPQRERHHRSAEIPVTAPSVLGLLLGYGEVFDMQKERKAL